MGNRKPIFDISFKNRTGEVIKLYIKGMKSQIIPSGMNKMVLLTRRRIGLFFPNEMSVIGSEINSVMHLVCVRS